MSVAIEMAKYAPNCEMYCLDDFLNFRVVVFNGEYVIVRDLLGFEVEKII